MKDVYGARILRFMDRLPVFLRLGNDGGSRLEPRPDRTRPLSRPVEDTLELDKRRDDRCLMCSPHGRAQCTAEYLSSLVSSLVRLFGKSFRFEKVEIAHGDAGETCLVRYEGILAEIALTMGGESGEARR